MLRILVSAVVSALALSSLAIAQEMPVRAVNGAVASTSDTSVTLNTQNGPVVVQMKPGWIVVANRDVPTETLKIGDFIGSANQPIDDASGTATEMRIYDPGNKPEQGTHLLGPGSTSMMTHGDVSKITKVDGARKVDITYPGGGRTLILPDSVQLVASIPVDRARAQPGVVLGAVTRQDKDGVWRAERLQINERKRPAAPAAAPAPPATPK